MTERSSVGWRLLDRLLVRWARPIVAERFGPEQARALLDGALHRARRPEARPAREPTLGGRLMVHAAALTAALYQELTEAGLAPVTARAETTRVTGHIYPRMAQVPWLLARLRGRSAERRLRAATDAFRRFPFGPPSYRMRDLPVLPGVVAFDVERCPVAEYFRARGLADVCVEAWCNLDFPLARAWGATLRREQTIAGGATHCDFRWQVDPSPASQRSPADREPASP